MTPPQRPAEWESNLRRGAGSLPVTSVTSCNAITVVLLLQRCYCKAGVGRPELGADLDQQAHPDPSCSSGRPPSDLLQLIDMGQKVSIDSNPFRNLFPFKSSPPKQPPSNKNQDLSAKLTAPPKDFLSLVSSCISAASTRTQEYLVFKDPEERFHPSPQVFLMTYMSQSFSLNLTDAFNCTLMTPEQRVLLGADWVWAVLEKPTKNPKIQIAVRVVHLPGRETQAEEEGAADEAKSESVKMARVESSKNGYERLVEFCASVGRDCYALFLFFGRSHDGGNIYGVLSNNMEVAVAKCKRIDRALVENFFKGSKSFHKSSDMMRSIINNKKSEPLTLIIKFS
ncbi:rab15 effector protein isoform X2 [Austrofundulus limnaeus]|uniref:Rab15 effector protein isoform X2 n=1 Tax=Austrofundulus limnaeus TaxID=52670 RepID=A0A2I4D9B9_AUSLI|nr:PREDICTED: rab15 effector protein isoform X2 [Austrofundulus limnaeus]